MAITASQNGDDSGRYLDLRGEDVTSGAGGEAFRQRLGHVSRHEAELEHT